ncbi:Transporter of the ATP-binding cassette (ABC), partial [Linderina pennispora]
MHFLYQLPAQIIITVVMLYQLLGMASIAGLGAILVLAPIQYRLVSVWGVIQNQLMKVSDRRMSLMNEILQGVRIIKFFAWERQFESEIASVRANELRVLRSRYLQLTYSILVFFMAPVFVTLATFGVYTKVMGYQLTASTAFTALALFKTLRGPIDQLPDFFSFCLQAKVSLDRVAKFMSEEETPKYLLQTESRKHHDEYTAAGLPHGKRPSYADIAGSTDIGFIGASFSWRSVPREDMLPRLAHPNAPGTQLPIPAIIEPENR